MGLGNWLHLGLFSTLFAWLSEYLSNFITKLPSFSLQFLAGLNGQMICFDTVFIRQSKHLESADSRQQAFCRLPPVLRQRHFSSSIIIIFARYYMSSLYFEKTEAAGEGYGSL